MSYKEISQKLKNVINEVKKHNRSIGQNLSKDYKDCYDKELWSFSLYYRLINLLENIVILLKHNNKEGILIIFRSCLDAYINLENIFHNYDDYLQYERRKLDEEKERLDKINTISQEIINQFSQADKIKFNRYCDSILLRKEHLSDVAPKYIRETDKRKNINLSEHFDTMYKFMSEHVHCGHDALIEFHMRYKADKYHSIPDERNPNPVILYSIVMLLEILWLSTSNIYNRFCAQNTSHNLEGIRKSIRVCINMIRVGINNIDKITER